MAFTTNYSNLGFSQVSSDGTPIASATTTSLIAAPGVGQHLQILRVHASNAGGTSTKVSWKETGGAQRYETQLPLNGAISLKLTEQKDRPNEKSGWHLTDNTAFNLVTDAAGSIYYSVDYRTVAS